METQVFKTNNYFLHLTNKKADKFRGFINNRLAHSGQGRRIVFAADFCVSIIAVYSFVVVEGLIEKGPGPPLRAQYPDPYRR